MGLVIKMRGKKKIEEDSLIREAYLLGKEFNERRDFQPITKFYAFYSLGILSFFTLTFMYSSMAGFQISTIDLMIAMVILMLLPPVFEFLNNLRKGNENE